VRPHLEAQTGVAVVQRRLGLVDARHHLVEELFGVVHRTLLGDVRAACGLTVRRDGQPFTAATSNDLAAQVDEIQHGVDQGPCLDATSDVRRPPPIHLPGFCAIGTPRQKA
jgi:hypothetical protein